jgi:TfoX N-terminal domain
MAYDESLAGRVRALLADQTELSERKMFGGLAFMVRGNMCCGIVGEELMVRVGPEQYAAALAQPRAREGAISYTLQNRSLNPPLRGTLPIAVLRKNETGRDEEDIRKR